MAPKIHAFQSKFFLFFLEILLEKWSFLRDFRGVVSFFIENSNFHAKFRKLGSFSLENGHFFLNKWSGNYLIELKDHKTLLNNKKSS